MDFSKIIEKNQQDHAEIEKKREKLRKKAKKWVKEYCAENPNAGVLRRRSDNEDNCTEYGPNVNMAAREREYYGYE